MSSCRATNANVERFHVFTNEGATLAHERVLLRMNEHFAYNADANAIANAPEDIAALLEQVDDAWRLVEYWKRRSGRGQLAWNALHLCAMVLVVADRAYRAGVTRGIGQLLDAAVERQVSSGYPAWGEHGNGD